MKGKLTLKIYRSLLSRIGLRSESNMASLFCGLLPVSQRFARLIIVPLVGRCEHFLCLCLLCQVEECTAQLTLEELDLID